MTLKLTTLSLALVLTASANAITPGAPAPDFKGTDANGNAQSLSQYRGKYVVLEWANQGCPYDRKHYLSGSMEALQKQWTAKGSRLAVSGLVRAGRAGLRDPSRGKTVPGQDAWGPYCRHS